MKIISGIRPTGTLHVGNYLGAIKNWLPLQEQEECLFFLADLHALTTGQGENLRDITLMTAAIYLACGLKPGSIFIQSHIHEHAELNWLLSCHVPMGWLSRMTQFKEKAENQEKAMLGLFAYPVLMAADVLLYDGTHVPVGEDQKQHVELIRDIALSVNHRYGNDIFVVPEPMIQKVGARIMSLRNADAKMGKSNTSDYERINLLDTDEMIADKIKKSTTDSYPMPTTIEELDTRKEVKNLLTIHALCAQQTLEQSIQQFAGRGFGTFKKELTDAVIHTVAPIREKALMYQNDETYLIDILKLGQEKAQSKAKETLNRVKDYMKL